MKRFAFTYQLFVIALATILLIAGKSPHTQPAYFSGMTGIAALPYQQEIILNDTFFPDQRPGVVKLDGDFFTPAPGYTGMIKVSGLCNLKRAPGQFALVLHVGTASYVLARGDDQAASFAVAVEAAPMQLTAWQENTDAANGLKCMVLFEAVR